MRCLASWAFLFDPVFLLLPAWAFDWALTASRIQIERRTGNGGAKGGACSPGKVQRGTRDEVPVMWYYNPEHPLRRLFAGLTEHAFIDTLGMADPRLVDYLSLLLSRFVHIDAIYRLRSTAGKRLEEVVDMLLEAEALPAAGRTGREFHRHIGDFTLFWTGVYPEALKRLRSLVNKDHFIDYCTQGKRSYYIASTYEDDPYREEAPVLRRLSEQFELCAYGLSQVRREWERAQAGHVK